MKPSNIAIGDIHGAVEYANGICVNVDHGLCYGGEGFVYGF